MLFDNLGDGKAIQYRVLAESVDLGAQLGEDDQCILVALRQVDTRFESSNDRGERDKLLVGGELLEQPRVWRSEDLTQCLRSLMGGVDT